MNENYIIISPVRNEEKYIADTLETVMAQRVKPFQWVIVNDGSTDKTADIVAEAAGSNPWITMINCSDRGYAAVGQGIVEAFLKGYELIRDSRQWGFLVKLDGDMALDKDYFEKLLKRFRENEKLGIAGGTCFCLEEDNLHEERMPPFHPPASARMYRRRCYDDIGGLTRSNAWDTIDLLRARFRGWETRRFVDQKVYHHRIMSSRGGLWEGKTRTGRNLYLTGYSPFFLIARCIYRLFRKPYVIESAGVMLGYFRAMLKNEPPDVSPEEKSFLRREQRHRLLKLN
jgi:glycosyltransferase involved in cell wall biosynthesis